MQIDKRTVPICQQAGSYGETAARRKPSFISKPARGRLRNRFEMMKGMKTKILKIVLKSASLNVVIIVEQFEGIPPRQFGGSE